MTGKEKCEFLKEIRKNMAKENGIIYEPRECHHEGYCTGTCPLCEKEAANILAELKKKQSVCDHEMKEIGHDSHHTYYFCNKCGFEERV